VLEIIVLTLIVIIAFVATSWYAHQRSQERAQAFERELDETRDDDAFQQRFDALFEQEMDEPAMQQNAASAKSERLTDTPEHEPDLFDEDAPVPEQVQAGAEPEVAESEADWDMVIAFTIMAESGKAFTGRAVKAALEQHDLRFGDMQIYHKFNAGSRKQTLFSVANIIDPGTLLPDKFVSMTTPGLLIFARLPGPVNGLALFDDLLETARGISEQLDATLCDETRQPVTDETLEATRSKILNYEFAAQADNTSLSNDY
jgi:cell division protein ZipA